MEGLLCGEMIVGWSSSVLLRVKGTGSARWAAPGVGRRGLSVGHREAGQLLYQRTLMGCGMRRVSL